MSLKKTYISTIMGNKSICPNVFILRLDCPEISRSGQPGQFVQIYVQDGFEPFLPRPFSLYNTCPKEGWIELFYRVIGRGTKILSELKPLQTVQILGPLGKRWDNASEEKSILLIGGGIGLVPLYFLGRELMEKKIPFQTAIGIKCKSQLAMIEAFNIFPHAPVVYTEDGSYGNKGRVTKELEKISKDTFLYGCGPTPMLKAVLKIAQEKKFKGQLSLEERMPCGFGICYGCVVYSLKEKTYVKICTCGPAFSLDEIRL